MRIGYQRLANIVKTTITAQAELLGISGVEELINGYDRSIIHTFRQEELQIKLLEADLKRERNQIEREKYNGGYLSKVSLEEEDNPERYKVEGLGLWGIIEGLIFHEGRHWTVEKFDYNNFEANNGKYQRAGGDFGFNDPTAFYDVKNVGVSKRR